MKDIWSRLYDEYYRDEKTGEVVRRGAWTEVAAFVKWLRARVNSQIDEHVFGPDSLDDDAEHDEKNCLACALFDKCDKVGDTAAIGD